jgi:hypothetical protein
MLETLVARIDRTHYEWVRDEPTEQDLDHILKELAPSPFDSKLREEVYNDLKAGKAKLVTKRGPTAKVLAIVYPDTKIPWTTFGKIFQAFGKPASGKPASGEPKQWRLVWFANKKKRTFPEHTISKANLDSHSIQPIHINGGYAYACRPEIIIYREEEVERVLVHELLHASCTDDMKQPEHIREVLTESWAEIFLIAILSTTLAQAKKLWAIQAQWIIDQETVLKGMGVNTQADYAWRYTVGRREVLESLGLRFPPPSHDPAFMLGGSLRFTSSRLS